MRIGLDAREAFRRQPRGIGLYVRHLMREFAEIAANHEFLLYHRLPHDPRDLTVPSNMRAVHTDLPGDRFHAWERIQMPWRIRHDGLSVYHGTYNTLPPRWMNSSIKRYLSLSGSTHNLDPTISTDWEGATSVSPLASSTPSVSCNWDPVSASYALMAAKGLVVMW